jgi:hypothetical protein
MDPWIKDLGGRFVGPVCTGILASLFTMPVIDWIVPGSRENLGWMCAIAAVCVAFFVETVILGARAIIKKESARKQFLMLSLTSYFAALAFGKFGGILWVTQPQAASVFLIIALLFAIALAVIFLTVIYNESSG